MDSANPRRPRPYPEELAQRRVYCLLTYLSPFRIVTGHDQTSWSATIQQVNTRSWDYVGLHEMVGGIDVGLPPPFHMVVGRDGVLALPRTSDMFTDHEAVEQFNKYLAALLLGGVYCEALTPDGLEIGCIIDWKYIRSVSTNLSADSRFHNHIRHCKASPIEAIALHEPRTTSIASLELAMKTGLDILQRIPVLRGEYLLKGVTGIARRDWGAALANLWIGVEQILSAFWEKHVFQPTTESDNSRSRKDFLSDTRTWTAGARIEMLYQKSVLTSETASLLSLARKARNELSHRGTSPSERDAKACYEGLCGLLKTYLETDDVPLFKLALEDHALSDPFSPRPLKGEPTHWMAIPKLPGEEELEHAETEWRKQESSDQ